MNVDQSPSLSSLDEILADLDLDDGELEKPPVAGEMSPKPEPPSPKRDSLCSPDPETEGPSFYKSAPPRLPKISTALKASTPTDQSPISENIRFAHHGPDLQQDIRYIKLLARVYRSEFERDPRYARSRFKARILPLRKGTKALLSKVPDAISKRKKKPASQRRPPFWHDMTAELQGVWIALTMRKTLPERYAGSEATIADLGIPCAAFTLNLSTGYEQELRRNFATALSDPNREHPALTLRKRIEYHIHQAVGRQVSSCVVTELSPEGRLHCHGIIDLIPSEAAPLTSSGRRCKENPVLEALRRAGDKWIDNRQHQADIEPCATPGWMLYGLKQGASEVEGSSISQRLQRLAKHHWDTFRQHVIEAQERQRSASL